MTDEVTYEPPAVAARGGTENPYLKSHIELMNTFNPLVTDPAAESKADFAKIADGWEKDMQIFAARIKRSSESAWTGTAASTARQAISDYATDALNLTPALKALSTAVDQAVVSVQNTKTNMPKYSEDPQSWWNPGDWADGNPEKDQEQAAQRHVLQNYVNPMVETDGKVPVLPTPKDPVTSKTPDDNGGGGDNNGGGNNGGNPTTQTPQTEQPETTPESKTPETEDPETEDPDDDTDSPDSETDDDTTEEPETPDATDPQSATPDSTAPQSATPQTPTAGSPLGGAGSPGGGSPGGGSPGGGGGAAAAVPGAAVPGSPGAAAARGGVGAGGAGAGAAGRNGMGGMGGMGAGGARGGNNDEDEHTTPDYLVYDRESELLGTLPPALPPGGVIGG